jgi:hypothetical protein
MIVGSGLIATALTFCPRVTIIIVARHGDRHHGQRIDYGREDVDLLGKRRTPQKKILRIWGQLDQYEIQLVLCNRYDLANRRVQKWPAAKARRGSMSFATCDRDATQAPGHFQLNPAGRSSLVEFRRRSLGQPRTLSGQAAGFLKFTKTPCGDWQAIPVTQH